MNATAGVSMVARPKTQSGPDGLIHRLHYGLNPYGELLYGELLCGLDFVNKINLAPSLDEGSDETVTCVRCLWSETRLEALRAWLLKVNAYTKTIRVMTRNEFKRSDEPT